jgi:hypothetical protein
MGTRALRPGESRRHVHCTVSGCGKRIPATRESVLHHIEEQHWELSLRQRSLLADEILAEEYRIRRGG